MVGFTSCKPAGALVSYFPTLKHNIIPYAQARKLYCVSTFTNISKNATCLLSVGLRYFFCKTAIVEKLHWEANFTVHIIHKAHEGTWQPSRMPSQVFFSSAPKHSVLHACRSMGYISRVKSSTLSGYIYCKPVARRKYRLLISINITV